MRNFTHSEIEPRRLDDLLRLRLDEIQNRVNLLRNQGFRDVFRDEGVHFSVYSVHRGDLYSGSGVNFEIGAAHAQTTVRACARRTGAIQAAVLGRSL